MTILDQARTFGDVLRGHARERPLKPALESPSGASFSFGAINDRVNRLNNACSKLGLLQGERAAILSRNRPEYVEVYGLAKSGVIVVPLNWRLPPAELLKLLVHSAPRIVFVDDLHWPALQALTPRLPFVAVVMFGQGVDGVLSYETLLAANNGEEPSSPVSPDDPLCLLYTSGTTGSPKGVTVTHAGALGNCRNAANEALHLTESDRAMAVMPLFHSGGMWYHLFPSFASACTTLVLSEFEPGTVLRELAIRRISNVHLVPTMVGALLAHQDWPRHDLSHLRLLFYAASSMPVDLLRRAHAALPDCDFVQCYGSTEAGVVTALDPAAHRRAAAANDGQLLRSCGRPLANCAVRITDSLGVPVCMGAVGEIEVASPSIMAGYWNDSAATAAAMSGAFLKTADLGRCDQDGFIYIVDRKNDMVITGGENVFPTEVEEVLLAEPSVLEAAVFGVPDPVWVERLVAVVVLQSECGLTGADVIEKIKGKIAGYKCPKEIYVRDSLPKNAVGKILRKELRREYGSKG
jgi:long-chain acyl-CoA synthetase